MRANERGRCVGFLPRPRLSLPSRYGFGGHAEPTGGFILVEREYALQAQNTVPLFGSVLRAVLIQDLVPAACQDVTSLPEQRCQEEIRLGFGEGFLQGLTRISKGGETQAESEAKKLVRPNQRLQGQPLETAVLDDCQDRSIGKVCYAHGEPRRVASHGGGGFEPLSYHRWDSDHVQEFLGQTSVQNAGQSPRVSKSAT